MDIQQYLQNRKEIHAALLECIENKDKQEESYQNLIKLFEDLKICENQCDVKEFLYLLVKISNKHHRTPDFFNVIERVLLYFKDKINEYFTNYEIFNVFKSNKRLLLTLFEQKIITADQPIASTLSNGKYPQYNYLNYFYPEFKSLLSEKLTQEIEMSNCRFSENREPIVYTSSSFEQNRKSGENDDPICQIIRNDSIDEFTSFIKKNNISVASKIKPSIYETNKFLLSKQPTLIEYSAFFNSIQIFNFLHSKNVEYTPSLWIYAIYGQSNEIIDILKKRHISPKDKSYKECLIKSIQCHHLEITNFLLTNFFKGKSVESLSINQELLKSYNFYYFPNEINTDFNAFYDLCQNNFVSLVSNILETTSINVNSRRISKSLFFE